MKKILILLFISNFYFLNAQNNMKIPPGTLKLNDSLYIDKYPVTNLMFLEYLTVKEVLKSNRYISFSEFVKQTNEKGFPLEMRIMKLPSPMLINLYINLKHLKRKGYGREDKFNSHPVLNILKEQATDFCKWRTEMVSHLWLNDKRHTSNKNNSNKITYRLAAYEEINSAYSYFLNLNNTNKFTLKLLKIKQKHITDKFTIFPIKEITLFDQLFNDDSTFQYTGFRCICELKK